MTKSYIPHYEPAELKAQVLCKKATTQKEKFDILTKWLTKNIVYDYVRAVKFREIFGPDIDRCYKLSMGICLDISCLAACMFRAVSIDANVAIGKCTVTHVVHTDYNGVREYKQRPVNHAWNEVYVDGEKITWDHMIAQKNRNANAIRKLVWTAEYKVSKVKK